MYSTIKESRKLNNMLMKYWKVAVCVNYLKRSVRQLDKLYFAKFQYGIK